MRVRINGRIKEEFLTGGVEIMAQVAQFYGFKVFMDNKFEGKPEIYVEYEEDDIKGYYDLETGEFENVVFPYYLIDVIKEWICDNMTLLKRMWSEKRLLEIPEWEEV